ncbi:MAG: InlB B-repeat-containing protein [Candidatus Methanomethylophilaceae archaeon]|nr:InlB B-repeat-containing protein [Candidatus Methanomethylophilaceae archaeon]
MNRTAIAAVVAAAAVVAIAAAAFVLMNGSGNDNKEPEEPQTYTVAFDANGGSGVPSQTVKSGDRAVQPVTVRSGHELDGWYTSLTGGNKYDFGEAVTGNMTLFARWNDAFKNISSRADFMAIRDDVNGYYRLTKDIDLGEWTDPLYIDFNGTLDGGGHEISYSFAGTAAWRECITPDGGSVYSYGLFENLDEGGEVRDLRIRTSVIADLPYADAQIDSGMIAGSSFGGVIKGCTVNGTFYFKSKLSNEATVIAGGLIGTAERETLSVKDCVCGASLAANASVAEIGGAVGYMFAPLDVDGFVMNGEIAGLGGVHAEADGDWWSVVRIGGVFGYSGSTASVSDVRIAAENLQVIRTSHIGGDTSHENSDPKCYIRSIGNGDVTMDAGENTDLSGNIGPYDERYKGIDWNG